jgi:hypothetical protein
MLMLHVHGDILANLTAVGTCLRRWACAADQQEAEGFPERDADYRKRGAAL